MMGGGGGSGERWGRGWGEVEEWVGELGRGRGVGGERWRTVFQLGWEKGRVQKKFGTI